MARTTKGRIFKRGETWYVQYYLTGKQIVQSLKTSNRQEAKQRADEKLAGLRLHGDLEQAKAAAKAVTSIEEQLAEWQETNRLRLTIANAWAAYVADPRRPQSGPATMKDFSQRWGRFALWMSENHAATTALEAVTPDHAGAFVTSLAGLSPNRFNKIIQTVRLVWKTLSPKLGTATNPFEGLTQKRLATHSHRELSETELRTVCGSTTGELRNLFAIGLYTALRLGDATTLRWENVSFSLNRITLKPMKTASRGKIIVIPLHPTLRAILEETPENARSGYVLPTSAEIYLHDKQKLSRSIQRHFMACGIETQTKHDDTLRKSCEVGFHSLRHSFVTICASAGVPLAVVQALCGHGSPAIQAKYIHIGVDAAMLAVHAIPDINVPTAALPAGSTPMAPRCSVKHLAQRAKLQRWAETASLDEINRVLETIKEEQP